MDLHDFNPRVQRLCSVSIILFLIPMAAGLLFTRMLPPPSPADGSEDFAHLYGDHFNQTQLGFLLMVLSFAPFGVWGASVSMWVRRMEGDQFPILTYTTLILWGAGTGLGALCPLIWTVAAYRAGDVSAEITQTLNDIGWFLFLWPWALFSAWGLAIVVAIFRDRSPTPVFRRWLAYAILWGVVTAACGSALGFFKTGPMAYDGIVAFWIPAVIGGFWFLAVMVEMLRAISREEERLTPANVPLEARGVGSVAAGKSA